ncbi:MAG TPA: type I-C CRISPR-associated protein Cas8c/Csd1 [Thermoanaerobaculia bacterium]|nr:type I-C CRISPR-associated protein Cas8c/Csd1 [Thermoanaerobaculia bacterium]
MILHELKRLAEREHLLADEAYGPQKIHYVISIDREGRYLGITPTLEPPPTGRGKPQPKLFQAPSPLGRRTSGDKANFLFDKADYVFGVGSGNEAKLANRKRLFRDEIDSALAETDDEGLRAVRSFLDRVDGGEVTLPISDPVEGAVFSFWDIEAHDRLISDRDAVRTYWQNRRGAGSGETGVCILCGLEGPIVRNHPEIKNVPGGNSAGVAIVTFNNSAQWSYGFGDDDRHRNAPFCRSCADAYTRALNRLLALDPGFPHPTRPDDHLPVQNYRLSSDTVVVFWSTDDEFAGRFGRLLHGNPEAVKELFKAPFTGRQPEVARSRFFAIILSGAQGRAILRSAVMSTVAEAARNLQAHFQDLDLVPQYENDPDVLGLRDLLSSLKAKGRETTVAPALLQEMFESAVLGRPYPLALLDASLRRLRAGEPFTRARLAIIKAVLNRRRRFFQRDDHEEITMALDSRNNDPGYRLGRLFAVLERLQGDAINAPNATIVDRYYGAASTTPVVVFPRLLSLAQHHAAKSNRGGYFQKLIEEVANGLEPETAFPSTLSMEQQGLFALGYYHQRADLWKKRDAAEVPSTTDKSEEMS